MDKYLLIDPTGLNLVFYPEQGLSLPSGNMNSSQTTVTGGVLVGGSQPRYNFSVTGMTTKAEGEGLWARAKHQAEGGLRQEIVIYNLAWEHSDYGVQTRENVPGLLPTVTDYGLTYWPVIQGYLGVTLEPAGGKYIATLDFTEGTIRINP